VEEKKGERERETRTKYILHPYKYMPDDYLLALLPLRDTSPHPTFFFVMEEEKKNERNSGGSPSRKKNLLHNVIHFSPLYFFNHELIFFYDTKW
jgi:hypothetical protein